MVKNPFYKADFGIRSKYDKKKAANLKSQENLAYCRYEFNVGHFSFLVDDTKLQSLIASSTLVESLNWNQFSRMLTQVASCYYKVLSPYWPTVPAHIRNAISVGLVCEYPWLQTRFLSFQKMKARGQEISGASSTSLDFKSFDVSILYRFDHLLFIHFTGTVHKAN